jgi:L-threonylcarbamoyladenylate synthase
MKTPFVSVGEAAQCLKDGGIVAMPTETVYGLAADGLNPKAVAKIFQAKQRPAFDPLILHVSSFEMLEPLVLEIPEKAKLLAGVFWPGPLTFVLRRSERVPAIVSSGLETVAVRMPSHPLALELIRTTGRPLAAPSANLFGRLSPTSSRAVLTQLDGRIDAILEGGECSVGVESTIVAFWDDKQYLLRPGGIAREDIESLIGPLQDFTPSDASVIPAPGNLPSHYAPLSPLYLIEQSSDFLNLGLKAEKCALLNFEKRGADLIGSFRVSKNLSPSGDLVNAAARLYSYLAELDSLRPQAIVAFKLPESGLGFAINDRLQRASFDEG